ANALLQAGRPDQALSFYQQAVEEAEVAEHWADVSATCQSWASSLVDVGQLDRARETYLRSAEASQRAGRPRVNIVMSEIAALRVHVMQGRSEQALPAIEARLAEVHRWWAMLQQGQAVPEAPDREVLARTLVSGLNIASEANLRLERWQTCLDL